MLRNGTEGQFSGKRPALAILAGLVLVPALFAGSANASYDMRNETPPARPAASGEIAKTIELTRNLRFEPATVTIRAGETVEWTNSSSFPHTVTADSSLAANPGNVSLPRGAAAFSERLVRGQTFRKTFTVPGVYEYVCLPHEGAGMLGKIVVEPAGG